MQQDGSMVDAVGTEQSSSDAMEASSAVASGGKSSKGKKAKSFVANISARRPQYTNQLMLSETMESVPGDLVSEWTCVLCPKGIRSLVTSSSGTFYACKQDVTCHVQERRSPAPRAARSSPRLIRCFLADLVVRSKWDKHDFFFFFLKKKYFSGNHATDYCILDCVYDASTSTFHVLDLMCWRGHPVYDCTTEFRYFWLQSKLSEVAVGQRSRANPMAFVPAPTAACDGPSLSQLVAAASSLPYESDGVLFVHKHAFYTVGVTPLSLWLKADAVVPMMASFFTAS